MINWKITSILTAIISGFWLTSINQGVKYINSFDFAIIYTILSGLIIFIYTIILGHTFKLNIFAIIAGLFQALTTLSLVRSNNFTNNAGFPMALLRLQTIYVYLLSLFFFGGSFLFYKLLGIIISLVGIFIVVKSKQTSNDLKKNYINKNIILNNWIFLAFISGIFLTIKDLTTKHSFENDNSSLNVILNTFLGTFILLIPIYFIDKINKKKKFINYNTNDKKNKKRGMLYLISCSFLFILYLLLINYGTKYSPNIGFVKAIMSSDIAITILIGMVFFRQIIKKESIIGIVITLIGIIIVSI